MTKMNLRSALFAFTLASGLTLGGAAAQEVKQPEKTDKPVTSPDKPAMDKGPDTSNFPKSFPVPSNVAKLGTVYYSISGKQRQLSFTSDAPAEKINGNSSSVIGYCVTGPKDKPAELQAGEWRMPVASVSTGIPLRDKHLTEANWFDAANHPNIVFKLKSISDVKEGPAGRDPTLKSYTATLKGDMTIKGVTKTIELPNTAIRFRPESTASTMLAKGDLLIVSCTFKVTLADYGITNGTITSDKKVAETVDFKLDLVHATVPPEQQGEAKMPEAPKTEKPAGN